ncbi:MAG: hypothetical protein ACRDRL_14725 [Sciscionella sp.]
MSEDAKVLIRFVWLIPVPQKPVDPAFIRRAQVFHYGQMPAALKSRGQVDARYVSIAGATSAQFNEVSVRRFEGADAGDE